MNFAVIKTGGKQYKIATGSKIVVEKLDYPTGEEFDFDQVLMVGDTESEDAKIGQPLVPGAKVRARVLAQGRADKKIVFKYHSKTRYKKKKGHRQPQTQVEILEIAA